jgi:hypothetical protein
MADDFDYGLDWCLTYGEESDRPYMNGIARTIASEFKRATGIDAKMVEGPIGPRVMIACDNGWCWLDRYRGNILQGMIEWCPIVGVINGGEWSTFAGWELWRAKYEVRKKKAEIDVWMARVAHLIGGEK